MRCTIRPDITYQFEYEARIPVAFIGAGGHSFRNVYPALQYAPVDLRAVCDLDQGRAAEYARMFGAPAHYADHREMLERERPRAVFVVTAYDGSGRVQATDIAADCLRAGADVWMEKPTAASAAEVRGLMATSEETGRFVMTGLKKIFTPAMEKVKAIITSPEFGPVSSMSIRYPQSMPPLQDRHDGVAMRGFLDHIYHPVAVLNYLMGPVERLSYEWEPGTGGSVTSLRFASGAIGSMHLAAGSATTSPLERVEVIGRGGNVVVENGVRVTYYRTGAQLSYGRAPSYVVDDDVAPLRWEPEFSLGQLYNKNLFYLGYVPEVLHFCECVVDDRHPEKGSLADSMQIMRLYELYRDLPAGVAGHLPVDS
jgi:predicted dehydrogenase